MRVCVVLLVCALALSIAQAQDKPQANFEGRWENHDALDGLLADSCARQTSEELVAILRGVGVPAATVATGEDLASHPQLIARGRVYQLPHPVVGVQNYLGLPVRFSPQPEAVMPRPAPLFGQDNKDVLRELGYDEARIRHLIEEGLVGSTPFARGGRNRTNSR